MKIQKLILIPLLILLMFTGCQQEEPPANDAYVEDSQLVIGTLVQLRLYDETAAPLIEEAFEKLESYDTLWSTSGSDSIVEKINEAPADKVVPIDEATRRLLSRGLYYSELSEGHFDITVSPLVDLWAIGTEDQRIPEENEIEAALERIDYRNVHLTDAGVIKDEDVTSLELGAIAKGFIADELRTFFEEQGVDKALINLGGNILVYGTKADGSPWRIGIQDPLSARGGYLGTVAYSEAISVVTSGIYERYFEQDGVRYHHLLDTDTGYPIDNGLASVSIISKRSVDGDGLSTAVFSLGLDEGRALVETLDGIEAIFVTMDQQVYTTSGLGDAFTLSSSSYEYGADE